MEQKKHSIYTNEMKEAGYTILIPTMLPMHFKIIQKILNTYGYNSVILDGIGKEISETGLKYTHNDTCYPAILVIGQFIKAIQSGNYDPNKVALLLFQTGGGCRASNYISLLRKALKKAGYENVPVISMNFVGLEEGSGFKITLPMLHRMLYAVMYGDLLMLLKNQCKPYELNSGDSEKLADKWTSKLAVEMGQYGKVSYKKVKKNYAAIICDFDAIQKRKTDKVKVGIVGEIFVKYSPLGNNNLEDFLLSENAEVVVPGFLDFCLYCVHANITDKKLYGKSKMFGALNGVAYKFLIKKQKELINIIKNKSNFTPPTSFDHTETLVKGYISTGMKMGEGWLLTAEMLELIDQGVKNIVCTQPFGCLPNHIVGKGMMKPIKGKNPGVNIVAIDYDAGATQINQENRIKLMLANAKERQLEHTKKAEESKEKPILNVV